MSGAACAVDAADAAWYLLQTRPRQEFRALEQLQNQDYTCFLPTLTVERIQRGKLSASIEPMFARYLFIRLDTVSSNWAPIRSTRGVSRLVAFGDRLATLPGVCIDALRNRAPQICRHAFAPGDRVAIATGPFAGLEGIYQTDDGEARAVILIELMSQPRQLKLAVEALRKAA
jgi:transcriptional antiterminator RfaH